jgi:hypothetical protein
LIPSEESLPLLIFRQIFFIIIDTHVATTENNLLDVAVKFFVPLTDQQLSWLFHYPLPVQICERLRSQGIDSARLWSLLGARIFKRLWSLGIDSSNEKFRQPMQPVGPEPVF